MKKRKKRTSNFKISNKKLARFIKLLREDKKFFALFGALLSLVLIIGSTFAWSSYSSWVDNHMQSETGMLDVRVSETFEQDSVLLPDTIIQKEVNVRNNSDKLAVIRVKLIESTTLFELNKQTGALLTKEKEAADKEVDREDTKTWEKGNLYKDNLSGDKYYVLKDIVKDKVFDFSGTTQRDEHLKKFNLGFSNAIKLTTDPNATDPYWVYEDGYFYYSKVLKKNETTAVDLLQTMSLLAKDQKNNMKNELYNLDITAYGVIANNESLKEWNVSSAIREMFEKDSAFTK
ncbi:hypothetical protein JZO82_04485 [Vagococcus fluvialis]|jgi:alternate signal-mediated exported protein|uniref:hypothetical protein n=1 Tax=Vagococcus fluvialis TaxID=2738 RepID=UPI001A8FF4C7|nr:hypothetical protein [Vagococcus fluvialis]MBO0428411.1 hypothetical protein [Vagococcus fluvialis]MDR2277315.1 hypothetical protein [Vagococcus sp.]